MKLKPIKDKKKIEAIFQGGRFVKGNTISAKISFLDNGEGLCFGISVPKKLVSSAVDRNLIKRRIREQIKFSSFSKVSLFGLCIFILYSSSSVLSSDEIKLALDDLAVKCKRIYG